jgi:hypothetical protein
MTDFRKGKEQRWEQLQWKEQGYDEISPRLHFPRYQAGKAFNEEGRGVEGWCAAEIRYPSFPRQGGTGDVDFTEGFDVVADKGWMHGIRGGDYCFPSRHSFRLVRAAFRIGQ